MMGNGTLCIMYAGHVIVFLRTDGRDKIFKNPPFLISHISSVPQCESLIVACQETMEDFVARKFK